MALHIQIVWGRINHPTQFFEVGQEIEGRFLVTMKQDKESLLFISNFMMTLGLKQLKSTQQEKNKRCC